MRNLISRRAARFWAIAIPLSLFGDRGKVPPQRFTPAEIAWPKTAANQAGSAMRPGTETVFLVGDGKSNELYSLVFRIPPNTVIPPHSHPDERSCFVLSGLWYFGYGSARSESGLKALPPGSHYTEPAAAPHFAGTKAQEAVLECTAVGPAGTMFVNPADDPKNKK
jgi:quercetin dioxygenase-like cupin family protein